MIKDFQEAYSKYDEYGCPCQVDIHITFVDRTHEEGELVEKIRQLLIAQMKEVADGKSISPV